MTNIQTATQRLAALKVFEDLVKAEKATARARTLETLRKLGVERVRATMPDGRELGTVTLSRGREKAEVVDERTFLEWVRRHAPSEIVQQVRDSYRRALLKRIQEGGEIPDGVALTSSDPYPTVRLTVDAPGAVLDAIRTGQFNLLQLPATEN